MNTLFLFDVDGTLSKSRQTAPKEIIEMLEKLKKKVNIAFVGGSDLKKQEEQINYSKYNKNKTVLDLFTYGFPENGVQFYKNKNLVSQESIISYFGENKYKLLINYILSLLSKYDYKIKRGLFIENRLSMINVSIIGRNCSQAEREEYFKFDKSENQRESFIKELNLLCQKDEKLKDVFCSIGGQISIDIFPKGWDKTYCLRHIKEENIIFFGDMVEKGGNDYEIYNHKRVKGVQVYGPEDTIKKVEEELKKLGINGL